MSGRGRRWLVQAALLSVAVYYGVWGGTFSLFDLRRLEHDRVEAEGRLIRARADVDSLRRLAGRLEGDRATIEKVARERFGMIAEGELLYRFVPVVPEPSRKLAPPAP